MIFSHNHHCLAYFKKKIAKFVHSIIIRPILNPLTLYKFNILLQYMNSLNGIS